MGTNRTLLHTAGGTEDKAVTTENTAIPHKSHRSIYSVSTQEN